MDHNELFDLVRDARSAFAKLGLHGRGGDASLAYEVRMMAKALDDKKFLEALRFIKDCHRKDSE